MKKTLRKAYPILALFILIITISAVLEGAITVYMMKIVDSAFGSDKKAFVSYAKTLLIIAIALAPVNILLSYIKGLYKKGSLVAMKNSYVERLFDKNINEFQKENNAKYLSALTNDMNTIEMNYISAIASILTSAIHFIVAIVIISSVSIWALFIGIAITVLSILLVTLLGKPLQKHQDHRSELFEGYTTYIKEILGAFQIIKANNLRERVEGEFYNKSKDIQEKGYVIEKIYTYFTVVQNFTTNLSFLSIAAIVVYMAIKGQITPGGVILIVNNTEKIIYPVMEIAEWIPKVFSVKSIFKRLDKTLESKEEYKETLELEEFKEGIKLKDVSFGYDDTLILENINLEFKRGEKYLLIGPSGGGKSTLLKLLRKYFNPVKGDIFIDDLNLRDIKKTSYFKNISNIEQQIFLFEDSIRNNITLYRDFSEEEIEDAIEKSGLRDFVRKLDDSLETIIYDNGKNISGGERQRIAIARGLLINSDIIFLDEAFSSLDRKVASEIEKTILDLKGVTVINVSHIVFDETKERYSRIIKIGEGSAIYI